MPETGEEVTREELTKKIIALSEQLQKASPLDSAHLAAEIKVTVNKLKDSEEA